MSAMENNNRKALISLVPVESGSVPALVRVYIAAFRSDQFSNLMVLDREEDINERIMNKSIEFWMSNQASHLVQAVDAEGEVVGWSCWAFKGEDGIKSDTSDSSAPKTESDHVPSGNGNQSSAVGNDPAPSEGVERTDQTTPEQSTQQENQPQTPTKTPSQVLGGLLRNDMVQWEDKHMSGKRYMILQALSVSPQCQGQGIGTKLVQWGTDKADAENLSCWVHASPASCNLYKHCGFVEMGKSDYDLDEWAPGGKGGNRGWGRYTFRYMLRSPKRND